jgi:hypothetical protein
MQRSFANYFGITMSDRRGRYSITIIAAAAAI